MNETKAVGNWILFLAGSVLSLVLALALGLITPLVVIRYMADWSLLVFIIAGSLIVLIYYFVVVFGFSWLYEQLTRYKQDYWFCSCWLLAIVLFVYYLMALNYDYTRDNPVRVWEMTRGKIVLCCIAPAWIRILLVTLVGAFYKRI